LVVIVNQVLIVVLINFNPFVLEVSNELFDMAQILRQAQELNDVDKLLANVYHSLSEILTNLY
jgi:hypothetical protein